MAEESNDENCLSQSCLVVREEKNKNVGGFRRSVSPFSEQVAVIFNIIYYLYSCNGTLLKI